MDRRALRVRARYHGTHAQARRAYAPTAPIAIHGVASTGMFNGSVQRMLDLVPTNIHERCPVILGSKRDVDMVLDRYK